MANELDVFDARLRRCEARLAQFEDAVSVYGPPDGRPLFGLRTPRVSLSERQTTIMVYGLFLLGIGLYTFAKFKAGEDIVG